MLTATAAGRRFARQYLAREDAASLLATRAVLLGRCPSRQNCLRLAVAVLSGK
jgi:hypothetical protein